MSAKRWRLIVTELGDSTPLSEVVVDAANWMAALSNGRAKLGEEAGVPAGASCAVAPNGDVTVQDTKAQRTYLLTQRPGGAPSVPSIPAARSAPPARPSAVSMPAAQPAAAPQAPPPPGRRKKNRAMSRTMAYIPSADLPVPPAAAPKPKKQRAKTMAFIPEGNLPPLPQAPQTAPPAPPQRPSAATPSGFAATLVVNRDEEPTEDNPLRFSERGYVVSDGASLEESEEYLRKELESLKKETASLPTGKLFTLAAYDASYRDDPTRLPIATLQFKDWSDETTIEFPLTAAASAASGQPPEGTVPLENAERRKAIILEACRDLLFLQRPEDGVELAVRLMSEVLPTEASNGSLFERSSGHFHLVAAGGVGARARRGASIAATAPLIANACQSLGAPSIYASFSSDPMAEGLEGVDATSAIYLAVQHHGQLLALLQLFDRTDGKAFGPEDARILAFVGEHLGTFLYQAQA